MSSPSAPKPVFAIDALSVGGFKSISDEQSIEVRPLTILAGANSSGKSSMMQPLLLLKQTLEAQYDPGPLLLNGPNVKFTAIRQIVPITESGNAGKPHLLKIGVRLSGGSSLKAGFRMNARSKGITLEHTTILLDRGGVRIREGHVLVLTGLGKQSDPEIPMNTRRNRCFFDFRLEPSPPSDRQLTGASAILNEESTSGSYTPARPFGEQAQQILHIAGLRGNPERSYPRTAIGPRFPGTFENYVASLIAHWSEVAPEKRQGLNEDLGSLGLTWKVEAKAINDAQIELRVGRLRHSTQGGAKDLVNIADVGFGVSQTLPVVVALRAAEPGQLVYIEQPEIHLHPRAQVAMAGVLAKAAARGVRVVVETHSSLLILAIQTLVAKGELDPGSVKLNWFLRDDLGTTHIHAADLDEAGRFGDWPEDFADVAMEAEDRYLSAAERRLIEVGEGG